MPGRQGAVAAAVRSAGSIKQSALFIACTFAPYKCVQSGVGSKGGSPAPCGAPGRGGVLDSVVFQCLTLMASLH